MLTHITYHALENEILLLMLQVVKELLVLSASTREERQSEGIDVENGGVLRDDQDSYSKDNERLQKALVSLCKGIKYSNLGNKLDEIASQICDDQGKSFQDFKSLLEIENYGS